MLLPIIFSNTHRLRPLLVGFAFLTIFPFFGTAQQFEPVIHGSVVITQRDSRSCNFIDINQDGFDDIFISNGPSSGQNNQLFLSNGNGTFSNFSNDPLVTDQGKSDGATFADVDNDGDLDAFVVTWYGQRNFFYRNNGDGSFSLEDNTANNPVGTYSETASWGDYDNDGWLDLYVTNSTDFNTNSADIKRNQLWHNQGDGTFEQLTLNPVTTDPDISRSVQWIDFDGDGDVDLFVSNEENEQNRLYENQGGVFVRATNAITSPNRSSTGSSWGDIDNDGDFDLFVANFSNQNNQLYINQGGGQFNSVTTGDVVSDGGCSFGSSFADFDNDGDLDLFVSNGFCGSSLQNFLYTNDGAGNFTRDHSSISDLSTQCSFGTAFGDYDNDGFLDLIIANCKGGSTQSQPRNTLLHNVGNDNNWVKFKLEGQQSNRTAIGAIVRIKAEINGQTVWQSREINAQSGYNGQNSLYVHFGLGTATQVDSLVIRWPSGISQKGGIHAVGTTHYILEAAPNAVDDLRTGQAELFQVYPNPVQETISIVAQSTIAAGKLSLFDSNGQLLLTQEVRNQQNIDLVAGSLKKGVYLLQLVSGGQVATRRIILQ